MDIHGEQTFLIDPTWLAHALHTRRVLAGDTEAARQARLPQVSGSVAILPLYGFIDYRPSMWMEFFGGTSVLGFGAAFASAMNNDQIKGLVIDVDSPGGSVYGVQELARTIADKRDAKPVVAVANPMAASAAYWIGTAAGKLAVVPSGDVGSIGVYTMHVDYSKYEEAEGVKTTLISAGKYKVEGNPFEPLPDEAASAMQARVDDIYTEFVGAVAKNRGVSVARVEKDFGQGRMVRAVRAVEVGMADRTGSLGKVLGDMGVRRTISAAIVERDRELAASLVTAWNTHAGTVADDLPAVSHGDAETLRRRLELNLKA